MKHQMRHWILLLGLLSPAAWAIDESELLPVDEAFAIEGRVAGPDRVVVRWRIADGYYMYRGRIGFNSESPGLEIGDPVLPPGEEKVDEFFGRVQTYRHLVEVELPLRRLNPTVTELELVARSQGCADVGVCYPPHRQRLRLTLPGEAAMPLAEPAIGTGGGLLGNADSGLFGEQALPVDQAFTFETIATSATELLARWTIADGYYLYRDKIRFEIDPGAAVRLGAPRLPPGVAMTDEHFGDVEVYFGQVEVPVPIERTSGDAGVLNLTGYYQGCKEAGICYPPVERLLAVALPEYAGPLAAAVPAVAAADKPASPVSETQRLVGVLEQGRLMVALPLFFLIGLGLTFTPCVFPTIPILAGIIVGEGDQVGTRRAFALSAAFVLAMVLVYTAAGIITAGLGQNVQSWFQNAWVIGALVVVLIALALAMFGFYDLQLPASWQQKLSELSNRQRSGSYVGAFVMGGISTLIVGACVAPPLVAVVQHLAETGDLAYGGATLAALGLGQGAPLLLVGATGGKLLPRAGAWMNAVKAVFGVALLGLAVWMLERIVDPTLVMLLWGILLIASGVYLGAFERIAAGASGWFRLWKALGLVLVALGALELTGAAAGGKDWLRPLAALKGSGAAPAETVEFRKVKSLSELNAILAASDRPALLDFYADWCIDCRRMDKYTFPEPPVQAALAAGLALKADVTANDEIDQELMRAFRIIGPPAILFFDSDGVELPAYRVIGYQRPDKFGAHVERAFAAAATRP